MNCSGRVRLSVYGESSVGTQASDSDASVWSDVSLKTKPSHLVAPPGFREVEDTEDYMAGLAEEIAQTMLEEENEGGWRLNETSCKRSESTGASQVNLSTSPQSTLEGIRSWDLASPSAGSNSDRSSGVSSPATPVEASLVRKDEEDALDLLYAELLRLKMEDEIKVRQQQLMQLKQQQQLLWKMRQRERFPHLGSESLEVCRSATSICNSNPANSFERSKLRSSQESYQRRRKAHAPASAHNVCTKARWAADHSSRHAQLQYSGAYTVLNGGSQHNNKTLALSMSGSGMRAVFLGTPGAREFGGTGVFLPRRVHDSKRKPACSTVLLPSRVIQALNLNVEGSLNPPPSAPLRREFSSHATARLSNSSAMSAEVVNGHQEWARRALACPSLQEVAPDVCLPTEWTY